MFIQSCEWFCSAQALEKDLLTEWVFTHSHQWFRSAQAQGLTYWMGIHPFLSVILICPKTGDQLTYWFGVYVFLSVVLISSSAGEGLTAWMGVHPFLSVVLICSSTGEGLTPWMGVHQFLWVVLICSSTRGTHSLDGCLPVLISGFDLVYHWWRTHCLDGCLSILVSGSDSSNTGEKLTFWMGVHPFLSVVLICSSTR